MFVVLPLRSIGVLRCSAHSSLRQGRADEGVGEQAFEVGLTGSELIRDTDCGGWLRHEVVACAAGESFGRTSPEP